MEKDEISLECEQNPLIAEIIQNAIKQEKGHKAFLPQELPQDAFDQLSIFSYEYLKDVSGNGGSQMDYDAVTYCVLQILDYQQNGNVPGELITDKATITDAIEMYCICLQFELMTRTENLDIKIGTPTLHDIFDKNRRFKVKGVPLSVFNFCNYTGNISSIAIEIIKDMMRINIETFSDIKDATMH